MFKNIFGRKKQSNQEEAKEPIPLQNAENEESEHKSGDKISTEEEMPAPEDGYISRDDHEGMTKNDREDMPEDENAINEDELGTEAEIESKLYDELKKADLEVTPDEDVPQTEVDVKESPIVIETEDKTEPEKSEKNFFKRLKKSIEKTKDAIAERIDGVFSTFKTIDDELYEELLEALIMADIGAATSSFIIEELKRRAREEGIKDSGSLKTILKQIISDILKQTDNNIKLSGKPAVIMVIGVNGVGKTTSIGKMAALYKKQGKKVILAAADTFRAAAIDQLEIWAQRAGVELVKHMEGSDPSSVVFDAIAAAKAREADIVICDTAGRLHNKKPLMDELKKTARIIERETGSLDFEVLLVLDASTGQNALIQAREFKAAADITGVILTKLDGTAKGGVIIPLSKEQGIGVKFIGIGEKIDDLRPFEPEQFSEALFGTE